MAPENLTAELARWTQQLIGISQNGLNFSNSPFDVERYHELIKLAAEMTTTGHPSWVQQAFAWHEGQRGETYFDWLICEKCENR